MTNGIIIYWVFCFLIGVWSGFTFDIPRCFIVSIGVSMLLRLIFNLLGLL